MDVWMLLCILFVASALFEYAILLAIRFGKQNKIGDKFLGTKDEATAIQKCRRLDLYALRVFVGLFAIKVCAYIAYILYARSNQE